MHYTKNSATGFSRLPAYCIGLEYRRTRPNPVRDRAARTGGRAAWNLAVPPARCAPWGSWEGALLSGKPSGASAGPAKVHGVSHHGRFFKVEGPLNTPPSSQGRPVLIQAGGSPRGVRASAFVADHVFGADMPLASQVKQRAALDEALAALGRDPSAVGILWQTPIVVAETERDAQGQRDRLLTAVPAEAVGAHLSYNAAYDFSTLPARFTLRQLHAEIVAANASPVGFVHELSLRLGPDTEITRDEFFHHGLRNATAWETTVAGTPAQLADRLEKVFEATGSRGGFMLGHIVSLPGDLLAIVDLLVPELQRRGRFRTEYKGRTLRENLAEH